MKEYHVTKLETKNDIAMDYADFVISVNDGDYVVPGVPSLVDTGALLNSYVQKKLRRGDILLSVTLAPVTWYEVNYTSSFNTRRRGIHFTCSLGGSDYTGPMVDNDIFYKLWRDAVTEFIKSMMEHLEQKAVKVYFRGKHESIAVIESMF